jgi:cobalt-zinc-cadmium efflux system membrane fusion protein
MKSIISKNISMKRIGLGLLLTAYCLLLTSCSKKETVETTEEAPQAESSNIVSLTNAQIESAGIELGKVEQRQISGSVKVNGMLDVPPQNMVSISVPMGGFLKSTTLLQGTRVARGQAIATVENLDFIQIQQDFLEAQNQLELAQAENNRQQELARENVNAQKTMQQAKSQFVNWQVKTNALSEKLKLLNIKPESVKAENISATITLVAPISGYVTAMNVNVGKFANPGDVLFTIVDTEHLHAELTVFEKDFNKIKVGQKIRFTLTNESKERTATVYLLGREIAADRTVRIHGHLDKEDKNLLPGMYLTASIETGGAQVNALPNDAIIDFDEKKYIFLFDGKSETGVNYRFVEVKAGNSEGGFTEIILSDSGSTDWQVVTKGAYALLSKMKNIEEEE